MRRLTLITALLATVLVPTAMPSVASAAGSPPRAVSLQRVAFRGFGGGFRLGGGGFGRRRTGFGLFGRRGSSRGLLHSIARTLAFAYLFHLFFSHGGFSILLWLIVIGLIAALIRRRGRNRYSY